MGSRTLLPCKNRDSDGGVVGPDTATAGQRYTALTVQQLYPNVRVEIGGAHPGRADKDQKGQRISGVDGKHMQIGEVAARTELSLRTIRHYEETGLVIPSARSQGGFRLYTETDVQRLMVIRRMKPLGFTLDQMRDLLDATDRLDADGGLDGEEREALLDRVRAYQRVAAEQVEKLRVQLSRAEDFEGTLRARLEQAVPPAATGRG
ncbi:merR-family transcriptional regulator [Streptomyces viridosporus ATCC 14672]|uniref:MerR-family transcriptional regulator n=2 Tax=Streptomyces viridosporus TaxID=67581 RepID=D5ZYB1_STRV1|nr:merR-family transcriptional regulator [Streptomyces viridosporus ATCC 14672]